MRKIEGNRVPWTFSDTTKECVFCQESFGSFSQLGYHYRRHIREFEHDCKKCGKGFVTLSVLNHHINRVHTFQPLKHSCLFCEKMFKTNCESFMHINQVHTKERPYSCPYKECPNEFLTLTGRKRHLRVKHKSEGETKVKCSVCAKLVSPAYLYVHMRLHTNEQPFSCSVCGQSFCFLSSFRSHQLIHADKTSYSCDLCSKAFHTPSGLNQHKNIHTKEKLFSCAECSKAFRTKAHMKQHIQHKHSKEKPFSCEMCGKAFAAKPNRDRHFYTHLNEKPHKCTVCGVRFLDPRTWKNHMKRHNASTDILCSACSKKYISNGKYEKHYLHDHMGLKADILTCLFCNRKSRNASDLEDHVRSHTCERPFVCDSCSKSFATANSLRTHGRTQHINQTQFVE